MQNVHKTYFSVFLAENQVFEGLEGLHRELMEIIILLENMSLG